MNYRNKEALLLALYLIGVPYVYPKVIQDMKALCIGIYAHFLWKLYKKRKQPVTNLKRGCYNPTTGTIVLPTLKPGETGVLHYNPYQFDQQYMTQKEIYEEKPTFVQTEDDMKVLFTDEKPIRAVKMRDGTTSLYLPVPDEQPQQIQYDEVAGKEFDTDEDLQNTLKNAMSARLPDKPDSAVYQPLRCNTKKSGGQPGPGNPESSTQGGMENEIQNPNPI